MSTETTTPNSGPRTVKLALLLPLAILATMVGFVGMVASLLLFNTKNGALALAAVAAAGILTCISLLTSRDGLDTRQRFAAVGAAVVPLALGGLIAGGVIGGIAPEDRMINVQPLLIIPEDVPLIGAENSSEFCLVEEIGGPCEPTDTWEVVPSAEDEFVSFLFDHREVGVPHNVVIAELDGTADDPSQGADILESAIVNGPVEDYYVDDATTWDDLPEEWYFYCAVHPAMNGVGRVVEGDA